MGDSADDVLGVDESVGNGSNSVSTSEDEETEEGMGRGNRRSWQENMNKSWKLPTHEVFRDGRAGLARMHIYNLVKGHLNSSSNTMYDILGQFIGHHLRREFVIAESRKASVRALVSEFRARLKRVNNFHKRFLATNKKWLEVFVFLDDEPSSRADGRTPTRRSMRGCKKIEFTPASDRTKRRRTQSVRKTHSRDELMFAASMSCKEAGMSDAALIVKDISCSTPSRAKRYRKRVDSTGEEALTGELALVVLANSHLSKSQYQSIRNVLLSALGTSQLPPYSQVLEAKKNCYPLGAVINGKCGSVKLQSLLNHTAERILILQTEVIKSLTVQEKSKLTLKCKWGFDGSSGHSNFKQQFVDENGIQVNDSSMILTSVVPVQLVFIDSISKIEKIVWQNPRPSSPNYCRPLRLQFLSETSQALKHEKEQVDAEIADLTEYESESQHATVTFRMMLTMIDGKTANAITDTKSTMRCHLCNATSKQFNNIDEMANASVNVDNLQFGISSLHVWIRFFECLLHISYKLPVRKWHVGTKDDDYQLVMANKKSIQDRFRKEMGLVVDMPKAGPGNSNDGNTARRFFENPAKTASITSIDEDLIERFHTICETLACGHYVHPGKFHTFALETARKYTDLYGWYYMPTTVHKVLMHGKDIIERAVLPIGQLSEEAQESSNKYVKAYRERFSRKRSRAATMEDVFMRLLVNSDPLITSLRKPWAKKLRPLCTITRSMLITPNVVGLEYCADATSPKTFNCSSTFDSEFEEFFSDEES